MFMGEFKHNVDAKGRLIIPTRLREQCGDKVVVTHGLDGCLSVYSESGWNDYYEKLSRLPANKKKTRAMLRIVTAKASTCEFDKLGRINIPSNLRNDKNIEKECVIVGVGDHIEIWSEKLWNEYYDDNKDDIDEIFESLEDF